MTAGDRGGIRPLHTRTSLAAGAPPAPAGTLYVLGPDGGVVASPRSGIRVLFGRNEAEVHVTVGSGDPQVSRRHGRISYDGREWWLRNDGVLTVHMPRSRLLLSGQETPLPTGYIPLFIKGAAPRREHLLEVRVVGNDPVETGEADPSAETVHRQVWKLSDRERLVLTALAQRYLRQELHPQPMSWREVATELNELAGREEWNPHLAANVAGQVRTRLSAAGVPGLTRDEVGEPTGNIINHNLIYELLESTTLVPPDLRLLGDTDI